MIVVDEKRSEPTIAAHPGILLGSSETHADISRPLENAFEWNPERSPEGPVTILASGADATIYVYRNGTPIGRAALAFEPLPDCLAVIAWLLE